MQADKDSVAFRCEKQKVNSASRRPSHASVAALPRFKALVSVRDGDGDGDSGCDVTG